MFEVIDKKPFHDAVDKTSKMMEIDRARILTKVNTDKTAIRARTIISKHLRDVHGYSYPKIGKLFGLHHSTIMYYVKGKHNDKP